MFNIIGATQIEEAICFWENRTASASADGYDFCGYDHKIDELCSQLYALEDEAEFRATNGCL